MSSKQWKRAFSLPQPFGTQNHHPLYKHIFAKWNTVNKYGSQKNKSKNQVPDTRQKPFFFTLERNFVLRISIMLGTSLGRRRTATGILKCAADCKELSKWELWKWRWEKQIEGVHIQMMRWIMGNTWRLFVSWIPYFSIVRSPGK